MKLVFRSVEILKQSRGIRVFNRLYRTTTNIPSDFSVSDIGKLYEIPLEAVKQLGLTRTLPATMQKQMDTLGELVTMVREPLLEISSGMNAVRASFPVLRFVLWGPFGTGKSVTLNQAVHMAHMNSWVIIHLKSAMELTRQVAEVEVSVYKQGRINDPINAVAVLQQFKQQNQHIWKKLITLKTEREYEWSKSERTNANRPITDIVEMGISAPYLASDCVGALFRELKRYGTSNDIKVLVAIDDANSLWGKTLVKKIDRTYANSSELTLVNHFRNLICEDWTNGYVLLVADKKEISNARDHITVFRYTPLELFGEKGFEDIEPFIPVETKLYSVDEVDNIYQYYIDKRWLASEKAQSSEGKEQLKYLSAFNPFYYERLCAIN